MREIVRRARRELRELVVSGAVGVAAYGLLCLTLLSLGMSLVGGLGLPAFVEVVRLTRRLADTQRRRAGAVLGEPVPAPYPPLPDAWQDRARLLLRSPATWRDLAWLAGQLPVGLTFAVLGFAMWLGAAQGVLQPLIRALLPADVTLGYFGLQITDQVMAWMSVPVGVVVGIAAYVIPRALLTGEARFARWLLAPTSTARLSQRVERLVETRAEALDASAAELRRIERDLHDGAQARLVALSMNLGMAEDLLDSDPAAARLMLADARSGAHTAMSELRALVRGIHPPLLADRGLPGAVQALALASPVPVDLDVRLTRRLAAPVESAAYFVLAEALTNAVKHSGAQRIAIQVADDGRRLRLRVRDDGRGGADPAGGTGLRGMRRRLAAFDGTVRLSSPQGGPTEIVAELPCAS